MIFGGVVLDFGARSAKVGWVRGEPEMLELLFVSFVSQCWFWQGPIY